MGRKAQRRRELSAMAKQNTAPLQNLALVLSEFILVLEQLEAGTTIDDLPGRLERTRTWHAQVVQDLALMDLHR